MNMVGQKVKHRTWGEGVIVKVSEKIIDIEFPVGIRKLQYPQAFESFLVAIDNGVQQTILDSIKETRKAESEAKKATALKREKEEEALKKIKMTKTSKPVSKTSVMKKRAENSKMIFLVFQGDTFGKESQGGYIWAPCFNKAGRTMHHWDRLLEVRADDIILHSSNGEICAISIAKEKCYDSPQPKELRIDSLWEIDGRRVDCEYILLKKPIKLSSYKNEIIKYSTAKYSAFNVNGTGNQGYLYDLNKELAVLFVTELVKVNKSLLNFKFIKEIIG